jgi:hypothetical protein
MHRKRPLLLHKYSLSLQHISHAQYMQYLDLKLFMTMVLQLVTRAHARIKQLRRYIVLQG